MIVYFLVMNSKRCMVIIIIVNVFHLRRTDSRGSYGSSKTVKVLKFSFLKLSTLKFLKFFKTHRSS